MADVTFQRDDYKAASKRWTLLEDVCGGEDAIKARNSGTTYLPDPYAADLSREAREYYKAYNSRAVFYNATARTKQGLTGAAFRKDPTVNVPDGISYVSSDVDGCGNSINQQARKTLGQVLEKGRHGLLVDYPSSDTPISKAQQQAGSVRASIVAYDALQIVNWRTEQVGGVHKLSMVVLKEGYHELTNDGFGSEENTQYRVLRLLENQYVVQLYQQDQTKEWKLVSETRPVNGKGKHWDVIPFTFVGSENNDSTIDASPLYDMAKINLAHYRNSAEYEHSIFWCGHAQFWMSGLSTEWRDHIEKVGLKIGAPTPILLPENGACGFAQAEPNTLAREGMQDKEAQMVALGARLVQKGEAVKTATEAQSDSEAEHSVLSLAASNVSEAYLQCLWWLALYENVSGEIEFELSQDFVELTLNAQTLTALIQAWQSGALPDSDLWAELRKFGLIDPEKDDETIKEEVANSSSGGLNLDDDLDDAA